MQRLDRRQQPALDVQTDSTGWTALCVMITCSAEDVTQAAISCTTAVGMEGAEQARIDASVIRDGGGQIATQVCVGKDFTGQDARSARMTTTNLAATRAAIGARTVVDTGDAKQTDVSASMGGLESAATTTQQTRLLH